MKGHYLSAFALLVMLIFAFGSVDTTSVDSGGSAPPPSPIDQKKQVTLRDAPSSVVPTENPRIAPAPSANSLEAAKNKLAAAQQSLAEFESKNPRPAPSAGPARLWFAAEGNYSFHGSAIDADDETVVLRAYDTGKTVKLPIAKLDKRHQSEIEELFGDYLQALAVWKDKRQEFADAVEEERKAVETAISEEAEKDRQRIAKNLAERQAIEEKKRLELAAQQKESRQKAIEGQFSVWDGSHRGLTKYIKDQMHNPKSFEHVSTRYIDKGEHLIVFTEFRGTNAFGGVVKNTVAAKVDLKGNVLEVISGLE